MNTSTALGLSVANLVIWGCWPLIRMNCKADGPVFLILFLSGQFFVAFLCCIILDPHLFSRTLSSKQILHEYSHWKLLAILCGGCMAANGDFLCTCACTRIPVVIAFPIYSGMMCQLSLLAPFNLRSLYSIGIVGFCLVLGIAITYVIEDGRGSKPEFLFPGLLLALCAIISLALAEANSTAALSKQSQVTHNSLLELSSTRSSIIYHPVHVESETGFDVSIHFGKDMQSQGASQCPSVTKSPYKQVVSRISDIVNLAVETIKRINVWVYVCVLGGVVAALWSPFTTIGRHQPGTVSNPVAILFLYECGSFLSMTLMLLYYGGIIIVLERRCRPVWPQQYFAEAYKLPLKDKLWGCFSGGLVALGYACYFISSDAISPTIALGIASCEPLSTMILGALFAGSLKDTTSTQRRFMFVSAISFVAAVCMMTMSAIA
jgi:drug/metabolite transporter (DMT)-like permease